MPTYDYKCTSCGYNFELFQPMSAEVIKECPKCKGLVKRLIGMGAGPIFKGTGFYQTDYKNSPGDKGKKEGSGSASKENKDDSKETKDSPKETKDTQKETKSDTKPPDKGTDPK